MKANSTLHDAVCDWNDVNVALSGLVELLSACSSNDTPPADVLWRLLYMVEQYSKQAQDKLKQSIQ